MVEKGAGWQILPGAGGDKRRWRSEHTSDGRDSIRLSAVIRCLDLIINYDIKYRMGGAADENG
jgi:hypothetical protein